MIKTIYIYIYNKINFSNIYLITYSCQIDFRFKYNIETNLIKNFPNISIFLVNYNDHAYSS